MLVLVVAMFEKNSKTPKKRVGPDFSFDWDDCNAFVFYDKDAKPDRLLGSNPHRNLTHQRPCQRELAHSRQPFRPRRSRLVNQRHFIFIRPKRTLRVVGNENEVTLIDETGAAGAKRLPRMGKLALARALVGEIAVRIRA